MIWAGVEMFTSQPKKLKCSLDRTTKHTRFRKNEKIIGAIILNHEYEECYQNIYWQIYAEDEEVAIIHRFCIPSDYRGCGKYLLKQIIKIAKKMDKNPSV